MGVVLAMEESQAASRQMTIEETNAAVNGLKTGFMGPIAGVGDVIDWATISTILLGLGLPFASQGSWIGAAIAFLIFPITISEGFFFTNLGYSLGTKAMDSLLTSGLIDKLIASTGMIGMFMMGALGSTYVKVALANAEAQATLDAIIPGMLSLALIFLLNRIIVAHK
ncbi:MAG: PTS system mannose/fructose/sorbose family transporter subunit IID, partial [Atopobiaceae bacterium]|nr:PTS system mannose/fructose/sorbose family transporter subunit IID [Atopobiaceae bacterium]